MKTSDMTPLENTGDNLLLPAPRRSWWDWVKPILARNPFYPLSAGLLLWGIYQLSVDPYFLGGEQPKLLFNFAALQFYELLLAGLAILLARRRIRYDSILLVFLDSLLMLVPLILVTQAVLIGRLLALGLSMGGAALIFARVGCMRRFIEGLQMSPTLLGVGMLIILANLALPFVYRPIMELDVADWAGPNQLTWWVVLPGLYALAFALRPSGRGTGSTAQPSWLPLLLFHSWIAGSAAHLYCVGYVSNLQLQPFLLAPLFWVFAWSLLYHLPPLLPEPSRQSCSQTLTWLPVATTLLGLETGRLHLFLALTMANVVLYAAWFARHKHPPALQALLISLSAVLVGMSGQADGVGLAEFSRTQAAVWLLLAYLPVRALFSSSMAMALLAAVAVAFAPSYAWRGLGHAGAFHFGIQAGLMFLFFHDLCWLKTDNAVRARVRALGAATWIAHSYVWTNLEVDPAAIWVVSAQGFVLGTAWIVARLMAGRWASWIFPATGGLLLLASPASRGFRLMLVSPKGLLALAGSLVMLAAGTVVALSKARWHRPPQSNQGAP